MADTDLEKQLGELTDDEKTSLLSWYRELPESEEELDALTQTPFRSGKRLWTDSEDLVKAVDALLWSIMGPDSPYQFANFRQLYEAYRRLQDKHAPYSEYLGAQYFQFFVRKWVIKNEADWNEKNQTGRNKVNIRFPTGYIIRAAGWGKRKLTHWVDGEKLYTVAMIDLDTVWNSAAYYEDQPAHAEIKT